MAPVLAELVATLEALIAAGDRQFARAGITPRQAKQIARRAVLRAAR